VKRVVNTDQQSDSTLGIYPPDGLLTVNNVRNEDVRKVANSETGGIKQRGIPGWEGINREEYPGGKRVNHCYYPGGKRINHCYYPGGRE